MDSIHLNHLRMKKTLLFAWALPLLAGGCSDSQTQPPGPEPETPTLALRCEDAHVTLSDEVRAALLEAPAAGLDAVVFTVLTNQEDFDAAPESKCGWITLTKEVHSLRLAVAQNSATEPRDCRIRLTAPIHGGGNPRPLKR